VVFGVVFAAEAYADGGSLWRISVSTLGWLGGNAPKLTIGDNQWWRLVTAGLMHDGLLHIGFNVYAMLMVGSAVERAIGPGWVVGAFVFSAITGNLLSASANAPNIVAIGASGGIFGLVAMAAAMSYLAPRLAWFHRGVLTQMLVFSLAIGFVAGFDNWGHIGGVVGGALCALIAVACRRQPDTFRLIGKIGGAAGLVTAVVCVALAIMSLSRVRAE